jgi:amidase
MKDATTLSRRALLASTPALGMVATGPALAQRARPRLSAFDSDTVATASAIRSGQLTAAAAVNAAIARAEVAEPRINALVTRTFERAVEASATRVAGVFAGVPTSIKDLHNLAGVRTLSGSRSRAGNPPATADSEFVGRMASATGMISLGKSATPEFGSTASSEAVVSGPCRNPWNTDHTPGGSSGGAAALVAAGVIPLAHASDGGGSIRIPAACCGLVGLKASRGRLKVSQPLGENIPDLSVEGCVTRTVRDSAVFAGAMDLAPAGMAPMGVVTGPGRRRLNIAWCADPLIDVTVDPEVAAATEATARMLREAGHTVTQFKPIVGGKAFEDAFLLLWAAGSAQTVQRWAAANPGRQPGPDVFEVWTLWLAGHFARNQADFPRALRALNGFSAGFERTMLPGFDAIITPVTATTAPAIGHLSPMIDGEEHSRRIRAFACYTAFQNVAGAPAISLPLVQHSNGLPIGVQITAKIGDDRMLLELAYELERLAPWHARRPQVWTL